MPFYRLAQGARATTYWHLTDPESSAECKRYLDSKGIRYTKTSTNEHLFHVRKRAERGLAVYDKYTLRELRSMCVEKYHKLPSGLRKARSAERATLVCYLNEEDEKDDVKFSRFTELPKELRLMVYEQHLWEVEKSSYCRHGAWSQPPITRVSRTLREESLPLFYESCIFTVCIREAQILDRHRTDDRFLKQAPVETLQAIPRIRFLGKLLVSRHAGWDWILSIECKTGAYKIEPGMKHPGVYGKRKPDAVHREMEKRVSAFVARRRNKDGRFSLRSGDDVHVKALFAPIE